MTNPRRDPYKGRQMYSKDTVTQKQLDRKVDRVEMRLDHHIVRLRAMRDEIRLLQTQMSRLGSLGLLRNVEQEKEEE